MQSERSKDCNHGGYKVSAVNEGGLSLDRIISPLTAFLMPKLRAVVQFMLMQGVTLIGTLLYGLLCVRLLPTSDYAEFVVLFGVQGTLVVLMDINFSGTLIPLVGERVHDRQLIADYVASLRHLAVRIYFAVGLGLILFYPMLVKNRHWSWQLQAAMIATLLVSTWFMRISAIYGAILTLYRDRSHLYLAQMINSLGTLALLGVFWAVHHLQAFTAIWLNVAGIMFVAIYYFIRARQLLGLNGSVSKEKQRAIVRLALPNIPQAIFYALQGQISLLLITFFGRTAGVASIGALARLGQLFVIFLQMNPILVEPYFAKLPANRLKPSYVAALSIAGCGCLLITLIAISTPDFFLWVLGPHYSGLQQEVKISIAAGAVSCFSGVTWCINAARRFVYWWSNIFSVLLILTVQILFISKADLSLVKSVLLLNLATNSASLLVNILSGVYGFRKGPRQVESPLLLPTDEQFSSLPLDNAPPIKEIEAIKPQ